MNRIDLNCDLGESYGDFIVGHDQEVLKYITSANIACGFHAGDHNVIRKTVEAAKKSNVAIGAHPGFNDLFGFGRRVIQVPPSEIYNMIIYQLGAIDAFCKTCNTSLRHIKPHGAMYNMAAEDRKIADAICSAVADFNRNLIVYGLSGSVLVKEAERRGLKAVNEVFADRSYMPGGALAPRSMSNAVIRDPGIITVRVLKMITSGTVDAIDGSVIPIKADTICIHGDNIEALEIAKALRGELIKNNIMISSP